MLEGGNILPTIQMLCNTVTGTRSNSSLEYVFLGDLIQFLLLSYELTKKLTRNHYFLNVWGPPPPPPPQYLILPIVMHALVDYRGLFKDMYIGWPGKVQSFSSSILCKKGMSSAVFSDWKWNGSGVNVCTY